MEANVLSIEWRKQQLLIFLQPQERDSDELKRFKRWGAAFLADRKDLHCWSENPHTTGHENLGTLLLGSVTTPMGIIELYNAIAMDLLDSRIPPRWREHFRDCQDCRLGAIHQLWPYFAQLSLSE